MGLSAILGVASLVASVVGGIAQRKQAKKAARAQREASATARAQQANAEARDRRQKVREERLRRAKIIQTSFNTGVSGSSGELGAVSALGTNVGDVVGASRGDTVAADRVSALNQQAADATFKANQIGATVGLFNTALSVGGKVAGSSNFKSIFG